MATRPGRAVTVHWLEGLISNAAGMPQWLKEALIAMFGEGASITKPMAPPRAGIVTSIGPYGADSGRSDFGLDEVDKRRIGFQTPFAPPQVRASCLKEERHPWLVAPATLDLFSPPLWLIRLVDAVSEKQFYDRVGMLLDPVGSGRVDAVNLVDFIRQDEGHLRDGHEDIGK